MNAKQLLQFKASADEFSDRVFIVTGAGTGIGRAIALNAAAAGATIVLIGEHVKTLEAVYDEIEAAGGPQAAIYPMNFAGTTTKDFVDLAKTIERELGRLDAIVSNAGWLNGFRPFTQLSVDEYQKTLNVNLHAPFWLVHACIPLLQKSPKPTILFTDHASSKAYYGAFGVAKGAARSLVEILAHEYSQAPASQTSDSQTDRLTAVRANSIDPGPINTQMRRSHYPGENWDHLAKPASVVPAYLALLSDQHSDVTGEFFDLTKID